MLRFRVKSLLAFELLLVGIGLATSFGLASCSRSAGPVAALTAPGRTGGVFAPKPPPGNPILQSLTFIPGTIAGGAPATGRITFDRVTDGALVSLTSSDPTVLVVPSETVVPGQQQSGDYAITTNAVSAPVTITVSASVFGGETTLSATVTVVPATGPPVPDVVTIKSMTWRAGHLKITATCSNPDAILSVYLTNSGSFMFDLNNDGHGHYSIDRGFNNDPGFMTVRSNFGGSADGSTAR